MKALLLLLLLSLLRDSSVSLLLLDMNGKKPPQLVGKFSVEQYLARNFPVYAQDLNAVVEATNKAAKLINHRPACNSVDTVHANHSLIVVRTECEHGKSFTVRYITKIDEQNFMCDFELVKKEEPRTAQTKLLDFADYISQ